MAIEIVDFPMKNGDFFHSFLLTFTRGYGDVWGTCDFGMISGMIYRDSWDFHDGIYTMIYGIYGRIDDLWGPMGFHTVFYL